MLMAVMPRTQRYGLYNSWLSSVDGLNNTSIANSTFTGDHPVIKYFNRKFDNHWRPSGLHILLSNLHRPFSHLL
jgi:hypothetical protein